ncbi:MAG: hypothetical protein Sylvanvirus3_5 [Sylvanvirus sp.]|uniref:Uncharacterized protein n=1 Tax=Sylvanvirus sp. TaxID=2487774 RepID=A0A3G5AJG3_9VIRU|nr:MAG: hypothetical protein Sylvanvirus3_5 [Sylvanvirus sp.]
MDLLIPESNTNTAVRYTRICQLINKLDVDLWNKIIHVLGQPHFDDNKEEFEKEGKIWIEKRKSHPNEVLTLLYLMPENLIEEKLMIDYFKHIVVSLAPLRYLKQDTFVFKNSRWLGKDIDCLDRFMNRLRKYDKGAIRTFRAHIEQINVLSVKPLDIVVNLNDFVHSIHNQVSELKGKVYKLIITEDYVRLLKHVQSYQCEWYVMINTLVPRWSRGGYTPFLNVDVECSICVHNIHIDIDPLNPLNPLNPIISGNCGHVRQRNRARYKWNFPEDGVILRFIEFLVRHMPLSCLQYSTDEVITQNVPNTDAWLFIVDCHLWFTLKPMLLDLLIERIQSESKQSLAILERLISGLARYLQGEYELDPVYRRILACLDDETDQSQSDSDLHVDY